MNRFILFALLASPLVSMIGCGDGRPARYPVSGQVLIDGQPLAHGFIRVTPKGERAAQSKLDDQGRFTLTSYEEGDGVVPGTHPVAVIGLETLGPASQKWHAPKRYSKTRTAELTITVDEPTEEARIELSWDGGKPFVENFGAE